MKDMVPYIAPREAFRKKLTASETTADQKGEELDTFGFDSVTFLVAGKWDSEDAGKAVQFEVWHGDETGHLEKCDPRYLSNGEDTVTYAAPTAKVGYTGGRRYVELHAHMSETLAHNVDVVAVAALMRPMIAPTA